MLTNLSRVLLCTCLYAAAVAAAERPPNVVLIMADDVSWECFGCYGAEDYQTPQIDALAAKGMRFNHCYSTPICTPSRVKLMTGQYSFRNYTHFGYLHPGEKTFAQMMRSAGYKTAVAGKWQLNGLYHGAAGSDDKARPQQAGFDEHCLWQLTKTVADPDGGERFWSPVLEQNGKLLSKQDNQNQYGPDIMSDFLCNFIRRHHDEPFFVYYPTVLVHNPFVPTPDSIADGPRNHQANRAPKNAAKRKANFVAMVEYLDKIVGKIVAEVEQLGQLDNTIFLFTADNGTNRAITSNWNTMRIRGGKATTTDMGTHVPLVAYWKGHTPAGSQCDDLIDFTDFYPTLAAAAGVRLGADDPIDGRSFLPQLQGLPGQPRPWVLCHYQPYWGNFSGRQFVRDQSYKLYRDGGFFHVPEDLQEQQNLSPGQRNADAASAWQRLAQAMQNAPPAPPTRGGRNATNRPTYPNWKHLLELHD